MAEDAYLAAQGDYDTEVQRGYRLLRELIRLRKRWAGQITEQRYGDAITRIFYHDALGKYREYFDMAQKLVYMTAVAYDYDTNVSVNQADSGLSFRRDIVGMRTLGQISGDVAVGDPIPVAGAAGLGDPMARMQQNYSILRGQLGLNNPQDEASLFSLRHGLFRLRDDSDAAWRNQLQKYYVRDIWSNPKVARKAKRPFGIEGLQPGLVIPFESTVMPGMNFFANPLGGGDLAFDPTQIATKILDTGIFFEGYDGQRLATTPRVYLLPAGKDVLRPRGDEGILRFFDVEEVVLPVPLPIGEERTLPKDFVMRRDGLEQPMYQLKKHGRMRAYPVDSVDEIEPDGFQLDTRLIGRSVWNTEWLLVIPGDALHNDRNMGLDRFIEDVRDIHLWMTTYAYQGATE
jgi:hypothetical protein